MFVAQPADVEIIFERLIIVLHSESLCDFHREIVMNTERPLRHFTGSPVVLAIAERSGAILEIVPSN